MPGINTGILINARPLTTAQISEVEKRALENRETIAYLNEQGKICFAGLDNPEPIKELAWHHVYELAAGDDALTKKAYKKDGLKSFRQVETYKKQVYEDDWMVESNFRLADGCVFITSDNFILCTKEI